MPLLQRPPAAGLGRLGLAKPASPSVDNGVYARVARVDTDAIKAAPRIHQASTGARRATTPCRQAKPAPTGRLRHPGAPGKRHSKYHPGARLSTPCITPLSPLSTRGYWGCAKRRVSVDNAMSTWISPVVRCINQLFIWQYPTGCIMMHACAAQRERQAGGGPSYGTAQCKGVNGRCIVGAAGTGGASK